MFDRANYESTTVDELMHDAPAEVEVNMPMEAVMQLFDETQAWNLPVVRDGIYLGFISKSTIFSAYRQQLKTGSGKSED
jgi:CIC family chloride channel protein